MAKRKNGYVEPSDFFPPEVRKIFDTESKPKTGKQKTTAKKPTAKK